MRARNCAGTAVEFVEADVTAPGAAGRTRRRRSISSSPTRPTFPTARSWNPKWPNMIRTTRCSVDRTAWRSSSPIVALAARLLRPGGRFGVEHDDTTSAQTVERSRATGRFGDITARRDLTGRPRFVTATRDRSATGTGMSCRRSIAPTPPAATRHRLGGQRRSRAAGWSCCRPTPSTASAPTRSTARPSRRCWRPRAAGRDMPVPVLVGSWNTIDGLVYSVPHARAS